MAEAFGYALTKTVGGHLRGTLPNSAALSRFGIVSCSDNEETSVKQPPDLEAR